MVYTSQFPPVDIPDVDIWTLLFENKNRSFPEDKVIFIDAETQRSLTYSQIKSDAVEFGKGLKSQWGWQKGDVMGFFAPNNIETPPAMWGVLWAGGVNSTANPTYTAKELTFQMQDSRAKGIVTIQPLLPIAIEAANAAGIPKDRILLIGEKGSSSGKFKHYTEIRNTSYLSFPTRTKLDPRKDLAYLVYSSGTTGLPKGVMLTHRNLVSNIVQSSGAELLNGISNAGGPDGQGDRQLAVLPFFHVYGLTCILHATVYCGFQAVVLPKFELEQACSLIQRHRITFAYVPPPIILGLGKHPVVSKYDLSSLKWLNSGAAPLSKELVDALWERLRIPVKQGYGLSECAPVTHMQTVAEWAKHIGSVGKLVSHVESKIVDPDTGNEVTKPGEAGEIWIRGPNIFPGYINRPELNKDNITEDGFFKTGDIGYVDDTGNFYITDRLKELIKYKGFQVAPAELEGVLLSNTEIVDACVIGAYDKDRATEVPRAYLVLAPGVDRSDAKAEEIIKWIESKVAPHKRLRGGVRFIDEVPKNASGKLLRRVLKDLAKAEERKEGPKL